MGVLRPPYSQATLLPFGQTHHSCAILDVHSLQPGGWMSTWRREQQTHSPITLPNDARYHVKLARTRQRVPAHGFLQEHSTGSLQIAVTPQPGFRLQHLPAQRCRLISNPGGRRRLRGRSPRRLPCCPHVPVCEVGTQANGVAKGKVSSPKGQTIWFGRHLPKTSN